MQIIHLSNKLNKKHMLMYLIVGGVLYDCKCGPNAQSYAKGPFSQLHNCLNRHLLGEQTSLNN